MSLFIVVIEHCHHSIPQRDSIHLKPDRDFSRHWHIKLNDGAPVGAKVQLDLVRQENIGQAQILV